MKRLTTTLTTLAIALPLFALASPAEAGHKHRRNSNWVAGADFRVGGVSFTVGFHSPERYRHDFRPHYFYRTTRNLRYDRHKCSSVCYVRDRYRYHDRSCNVVRYHLSRYDFDPHEMWAYVTYGGPYGQYSNNGYYPRSRYDRGYSRRDYRNKRYYRNDRYRGHRHDRRCRH